MYICLGVFFAVAAGEFQELVPGQRLVMSWRFNSWEDDCKSKVGNGYDCKILTAVQGLRLNVERCVYQPGMCTTHADSSWISCSSLFISILSVVIKECRVSTWATEGTLYCIRSASILTLLFYSIPANVPVSPDFLAGGD
jgi:hypothetical protein